MQLAINTPSPAAGPLRPARLLWAPSGALRRFPRSLGPRPGGVRGRGHLQSVAQRGMGSSSTADDLKEQTPSGSPDLAGLPLLRIQNRGAPCAHTENRGKSWCRAGRVLAFARLCPRPVSEGVLSRGDGFKFVYFIKPRKQCTASPHVRPSPSFQLL